MGGIIFGINSALAACNFLLYSQSHHVFNLMAGVAVLASGIFCLAVIR